MTITNIVRDISKKILYIPRIITSAYAQNVLPYAFKGIKKATQTYKMINRINQNKKYYNPNYRYFSIMCMLFSNLFLGKSFLSSYILINVVDWNLKDDALISR